MRGLIRNILVLLTLAAPAVLCAQVAGPTQQPQPVGSPMIEADAAAIEADTRYLADDLLEGREAGTRGDRLTQLYLASRFKMVGLQPAGDAGSYLQMFGLRSTQLVNGSASVTLSGPRGRHFANGDDVLVFGHPTEADQRVEAPLVFAGYGIVSKRHGIDDYRGLDVRGRIVVLMGGPPAFLPPAEAAHLASSREQHSEAARRGAVGVIHLWTPALEQRYPFAMMRPLLDRRDMNWLGPQRRPAVVNPAIRATAFLHGASIEAALAGAPRDFGALLNEARTRSPRGFALTARMSLARRSKHDDSLTTANVAGLLLGSDPALRNEVVVLTAHHDHVGVGKPIDGDTIYNGALDNAVGTAMLLDVATRLSSAEQRPKRSILFLAVAAEEKGLLGSDYFVENPTIAPREIVANVNLDGAFPFYDFRDVIAFGADQSEIERHLIDATAELSLSVAPDPFPEESIFTRSDQYSFMRRGIPGVFLYNGFTDMAGQSVGRKVWDDAMANVVHLPTDDLKQPIDWRALAKFSDVFRRLTIRLANADKRPQWRKNSLFAEPAKQFIDRGR